MKKVRKTEKLGFRLSKPLLMDMDICREAAALRQSLRLKLPDIMIYASAKAGGGVLVTRNTKDFKPEWDDVYCPYSKAA